MTPRTDLLLIFNPTKITGPPHSIDILTITNSLAIADFAVSRPTADHLSLSDRTITPPHAQSMDSGHSNNGLPSALY
jgi:hypothetical protein